VSPFKFFVFLVVVRHMSYFLRCLLDKSYCVERRADPQLLLLLVIFLKVFSNRDLPILRLKLLDFRLTIEGRVDEETEEIHLSHALAEWRLQRL